jgi:ABC-type branched-subunit amino acid transport system ATPase component/ABC-type branched-subunit amino acid transport system permease subunit
MIPARLRPLAFPALALLVGALLVAAPYLVANAFQLRVVMLFLVYALVALGLNVLVGLAGLVSLGQAGLYALGAYVAAILSVRLGWSFAPSVLAAMTVTGAAGVLLAYPTLRVRGVYLAVITIAFGLIVQNVAIEWREVTGGTLGISNVPRVDLGFGRLSNQGLYWLLAGIAFAAFLLHYTLMASRYGRAMRAVAQSETAGRALGINPITVRVIAFTVSAIYAGLAGALYAYLNRYVNPDTFSFGDSIRFLLMVILGGAGTVLGPLLGAGILTWLPNALQAFGAWQLFAYGALLALVIFVMPQGIVGTIKAWAARLVPRAEPETRASGAWPKPSAAVDELLRVMPGSGPAIETKSLTLRFGGLVAVDNVSEIVRPGTVHAVIGPNGAGKTSLLNALSGFYVPTSGSIAVGGASTGGRPSHAVARLGLTRTFQNTELFGDMSVAENVLIGFHARCRTGLAGTLLRLPGFFREERRARAQAALLLGYVGLSAYADELARNLPFGHQRRLEIARALALAPRVLLLDEPAAGLTHGEIEELVALVRDLKRLGLTIVLVEHHVDMIMSVSDHVTVLDYGRVIASGPPEAVRDDPRVIEAYFGTGAFAPAGPRSEAAE